METSEEVFWEFREEKVELFVAEFFLVLVCGSCDWLRAGLVALGVEQLALFLFGEGLFLFGFFVTGESAALVEESESESER